MKVQNINCEYIRILSEAFRKAFNSDNLKNVEVMASVNNGTPITKNVPMENISNSWTVSIGLSDYTKITQIYLRNFVTGISYPLLPDASSLAINATNLTMIKSLVADSLQNLLSVSGVEQTYEIITGDILKITFSRLPANIMASTLRTTETVAAVKKIKYFDNAVNEHILFNGDHLMLKPSFFGKETFDDGIYKITTKILDKQDVITREESCYFMDCTITGGIVQAVELEECKETDIRTLMLHYALRIASNRDCDCDEMQTIFDFLEKHIDTSNTDPCGC